MRLIRFGRLSTFACVAAFLIGGPFYIQVLGHHSRWLRGWQMYGGRGADWCFVHYHRYTVDNSRIPLSRFATLGIRLGGPEWHEAREIRTREQALLAGKELCRRLEVGVRIGFSMKCGDGRRTWNVVERDPRGAPEPDMSTLEKPDICTLGLQRPHQRIATETTTRWFALC